MRITPLAVIAAIPVLVAIWESRSPNRESVLTRLHAPGHADAWRVAAAVWIPADP